MDIDPKDPKFAQALILHLDQFEREADVSRSESRLVYAIMLGQIFKRYLNRFGLPATGTILKSMYGLFHREGIRQQNTVADQLKLGDGGSNPPPLPRDPPSRPRS